MSYNVKEVVEKLNEKMYGNDTDYENQISGFIYIYHPYWEAIKFDDYILWDSENDDREYLPEDEGGEKEDLYIHCVRFMEKYSNEIADITNNL